ncbi:MULTISPECIES: hypothetical protein [Rhizobium]|uniref:hypothetical protein n=1 Tax=Rhizobium TaxID=379 RepID=UPI000D0E58C2|nr:hypothetical protein [Rhizobium sp. H4]UWU34353.1 hypothetical protein N2597_19835 [Rhizobium leguminosarum bv. phaseoli]
MSLSAVFVPEIQNPQYTSNHRDDVVLPREESKRVFINGVELDAERISGRVVGSRIKQHNQIYTTHHNNYMANVDNHVHSTVRNEQWETSEVRLRFEDGKERLFQLPFAVSVGENDMMSIISLYRVGGDGYTAAAQNHNIGQSFTQDRNGLQHTCARLGVFKPSVFLNNKSFLIVLALLAVSLYGLSGSVLLALIGSVLLSGLFVLAFQYLVLLPYVIAVWPKANRQLQAFFDDFAAW